MTSSSSLPSVKIYIDESKFLSNTGIIKAAVPIMSYWQIPFQNKINILKSLNPTCKNIVEYHANKIKIGNLSCYVDFLREVANMAANIGNNTPLKTTITVEGSGVFENGVYDTYGRALYNALNNNGISTIKEESCKSFCQEIGWLSRHLATISSVQINNELELYFDNQYAMSKELNQTFNPSHISHFSLPIKINNILSKTANKILGLLSNNNVKYQIIRKIDWVDSKQSVFIQAADVFSHLFYNVLKYDLGCHDAKVQLKRDLFFNVVNGFTLPSNLLAELSLVADPAGVQTVNCNNPSLLRSVTLS